MPRSQAHFRNHTTTAAWMSYSFFKTITLWWTTSCNNNKIVVSVVLFELQSLEWNKNEQLLSLTGRKKQKAAQEKAGLSRVRTNLNHLKSNQIISRCIFPVKHMSRAEYKAYVLVCSYLIWRMQKLFRNSSWRRFSWVKSCWRRVRFPPSSECVSLV